MPQQRSRRRGVILTPQGLQKLQIARSEVESQTDQRYTREALGFHAGLDPDTVAKVFACEIGVDKQTLKCCFQAFNLPLHPDDYQFAQPKHPVPAAQESPHTHLLTATCNPIPQTESNPQPWIDWGEAPDVSLFLGRTPELTTLKQWVLATATPEPTIPCRLITLLGITGMGKTWLSVKLAQQLQDQFEFVIWRSLHAPVSPKDFLADLLTVFSHGQATDLPDTLAGRISRLMQHLRHHRCLLIFDRADFVLKHCADETSACHRCLWFPHKKHVQAYCNLLKRIGETAHQSCVILTSREKPQEITALEGKSSPVRVFHLNGLTGDEIRQLFHRKGMYTVSSEEQQQLITSYTGNPLALNLVSVTIQSLFSGQISAFLQHQTLIFGQVSHLLAEQLHCLPPLAEHVLQTLALEAHPVSFADLRSQLETVSSQALLEALEILQGRSLITTNAAKFALQPLVSAYLQTQRAG